jgi:hypothetical protein
MLAFVLLAVSAGKVVLLAGAVVAGLATGAGIRRWLEERKKK